MDNPDKLLALCEAGLRRAEQYLATCRHSVAGLVSEAGKLDAALLEQHQLAAHGFAWQATYVEALSQALRWARELQETGQPLGDGTRHPASRLRGVPGTTGWRNPDQSDGDRAAG